MHAGDVQRGNEHMVSKHSVWRDTQQHSWPALQTKRHRTELVILALAGLAGKYAADANDAEIVDPREYYQGSLRRTLKKFSHIGKTIPAMGYSPQQVCATWLSILCARKRMG